MVVQSGIDTAEVDDDDNESDSSTSEEDESYEIGTETPPTTTTKTTKRATRRKLHHSNFKPKLVGKPKTKSTVNEIVVTENHSEDE